MTYNSKFGEAFKMDCGKRHGTKYFGIAQAASFKECMDSCAEYVPCRSVDYTPKNGKVSFENGTTSCVFPDGGRIY